ncbi:DUF4833 domain-containing protein [Sinomicrobium sp. M5D2P17]
MFYQTILPVTLSLPPCFSRTVKLFGFFSFFFIFTISSAQNGYPIPETTPTRLFYIQHSNNYNTYVYDARMSGKSIDRKKPVEAYRIVYTEGGVRKPLNLAQKKLAYGMATDYLAPNLYEMHLVVSKKLKFYLTLDSEGKPVVTVTVNNRKMYLDRMFLQIKNKTAGVHVKADWVLFAGKDFETSEKIAEKVIVKD